MKNMRDIFGTLLSGFIIFSESYWVLSLTSNKNAPVIDIVISFTGLLASVLFVEVTKNEIDNLNK